MTVHGTGLQQMQLLCVYSKRVDWHHAVRWVCVTAGLGGRRRLRDGWDVVETAWSRTCLVQHDATYAANAITDCTDSQLFTTEPARQHSRP